MAMPSLSIVIPTLNEEDYLPQLLRSIQAQSVQPLEVIVADAGSIDQTQSIAAAYGARVVRGGLPGVGRNAGALEAKGDVIFFLDSDVVLQDVNYLESALSQLSNRSLDFATSDVLPVDSGVSDLLLHKAYNAYARLWGNVYAHAPGFCIMVRKTLHEAIDGFDETVVYAEDYDYTRRAGKVGRFGFIDGVCLYVSTRRQKKGWKGLDGCEMRNRRITLVATRANST